MMTRFMVILWISLFAGMTACNKESQKKPIDQVPADISTVSITMERGACFGACPEYRVTLNGEGDVQYNGRNHVSVAGAKSHKIASTDVRKLIAEFYAADFFSLKDQYTTREVSRVDANGDTLTATQEVTDLPMTTTSITIGSKTKTVANTYGAPEALRELEAKIDQVANISQYLK